MNALHQPSYLTGLIGAGIGPSLSPPLHHSEAARHSLRLLYRIIDIDVLGAEPEEAGRLLAAARTLGFDGLNITHPCKQVIIEHLDALDPEAAALGAVNTVVLRDGRAVGYNTDSLGFARGFVRTLPDVPRDAVVQLGAGGAGSAVAHALLGEIVGARRLTIVDRQADRARALAAALRRRFGEECAVAAAPENLAEHLEGADGLVNATPVGMAAHPGLPLPDALVREDLWVAEVVYMPLETELLRLARERGCRTVDGGGMLVYQAAEAFRLFTGRDPDIDAMFEDYHALVAPGGVEPAAAAPAAVAPDPE
ncbi:shikimate dehydrogenase [Actinospica durhamensis]|uniref:Shikimate dehydrogenase (NADP(+)) n=1 Tax=Actinospica durhamensis TaxID=1508375 RepID=A0A941ET61_9ACTN|nr:shikimate dehydrogenase [Actinospica durhamensis]